MRKSKIRSNYESPFKYTISYELYSRCKLEEKVQELENNKRIRTPEQQKRNDNNEVNKDILKDMSLLLQHRDEIRNIKETILSYQEKMCS